MAACALSTRPPAGPSADISGDFPEPLCERQCPHASRGQRGERGGGLGLHCADHLTNRCKRGAAGGKKQAKARREKKCELISCAKPSAVARGHKQPEGQRSSQQTESGKNRLREVASGAGAALNRRRPGTGSRSSVFVPLDFFLGWGVCPH